MCFISVLVFFCMAVCLAGTECRLCAMRTFYMCGTIWFVCRCLFVLLSLVVRVMLAFASAVRMEPQKIASTPKGRGSDGCVVTQ